MLVISTRKILLTKEFFYGMVIKVVMGSIYLVGYIEDLALHTVYIGDNVDDWVGVARTMAGVLHSYPQAEYARMKRFFQK